jgi:hypothetical protein
MAGENIELEETLAKNDELWQKRMLLFAMVVIIILLGLY